MFDLVAGNRDRPRRFSARRSPALDLSTQLVETYGTDAQANCEPRGLTAPDLELMQPRLVTQPAEAERVPARFESADAERTTAVAYRCEPGAQHLDQHVLYRLAGDGVGDVADQLARILGYRGSGHNR